MTCIKVVYLLMNHIAFLLFLLSSPLPLLKLPIGTRANTSTASEKKKGPYGEVAIGGGLTER